ncbi:DUF3318 domain-containing protein [Synechocystis sp. PCC 7509]|uniref:DUF3318 domain-containing protein n=1 Tax=Synechocystis sp. PCC 7509 TaxID=927677 RepID=UPI00031BCE9E|nr:DUF3318 domain-containing protein [Synechocystis sp. PCC 7509]
MLNKGYYLVGDRTKTIFMEQNAEIRRLLDLMPASGRMMTKIVSKPEQRQIINSPLPLPWQQQRQVYINFDLWRRLSKPQRDLLLLTNISWLTGIKWFKPDISQGVVLAGLLGAAVELVQSDPVGVVIGAGLSAFASAQIWRNSRSSKVELEADEAAIKVAQRRGYSEAEAAQYLLSAIEAVAQIEKRSSLNFVDLIRCQNLRAISGLSPVSVPTSERTDFLQK